jgi:hypothetical protein
MKPPRMIYLIVILLSCLQTAPFAHGADLLSRFYPYINIKEEYNDNLNLTPTNKLDDYITTIQPGVKFKNMDDVSGIDLDYSLDAVFYGKYTALNYIGHNAFLDAKYMTPQHFNFYLKEWFVRSENNRELEYFTKTADQQYMLATQTNRAIYWRNTVAPTIEYQFGPEDRLGLNYRNNIYRTESATSQDSREDYINPFFSYWFNRHNGLYFEYGYTKGDFDANPDLTGHKVRGRYTNRLGEKSTAFAEYTFSKRTFEAPGIDYDIHEPSIGITYAFSAALSASIQVGYFSKDTASGPKKDGMTYKGDLTTLDPELRTTYTLSFQGGYREDYFTSENLGFSRYHRLTGSISHKLDKRTSIGFFGSLERANYDSPDHSDTTWGIGGRASYMPLKWLTLALEISRNERQSNIDTYEYTENKGMVTATTSY